MPDLLIAILSLVLAVFLAPVLLFSATVRDLENAEQNHVLSHAQRVAETLGMGEWQRAQQSRPMRRFGYLLALAAFTAAASSAVFHGVRAIGLG